MTGVLLVPDLQRSYAVSADWLELITALRGSASVNDLLGPQDILGDPQAPAPADTADGSVEDPDIIDPGVEQALDAVVDELAFRAKTLGPAYPFALEIAPRYIKISLAEACDDAIVETARLIYRACLLMSVIRARIVDARAAGIPIDPVIGDLFQIPATIAAAGYVGGDAYWFGHPRPDTTPLLQAIEVVAECLHATAAGHAPPGAARFAKDAGIDVVAWRDHHDNRPAKLILYGQCASGKNWKDKSVSPYVEGIGNYFHLKPSTHWLPALFAPFPIYMDSENAHGLKDEEARVGFYRQTETVMGIVIDRLRIVHCCIAAIRQPQPVMNAALERLGELFKWSGETATVLRDAA